ncbi:MAG: rhodanese-like domain-containing protein [Nitrospiraceae bacterium]|nr:rhodanese-like domain-containing protein [Nitrospiraceae bacterium]
MKKAFSVLPAFALVLLSYVFVPFAAKAAVENPALLVNGQWLAAHGKAVVVDVRAEKDYAAGHIPGAINIPVDSLQGGPDAVPFPVKREEKTLGANGLSIDSEVVLYGNRISAFREFWILDYLGMPDIHVLDGGIENWKGQTATAKTVLKPAQFKARPVRTKYATTAYVRAHLKKPGVILLDARTPAEYHGMVALALRGGHIPGAININAWENFQKGSTLLKAPDQLKKIYAGLSRKKEVIVYCQNGSRAVTSYFTLRLLGFRKVATYIPSWVEWGSNEKLPVQETSYFNFVPVIKMMKALKK